MGAAIVGAPLILAAPAAADDISDLKTENTALKNQIESLARDLQNCATPCIRMSRQWQL